MTEQSEKSVGSAAFEIFANRIASEVVEENKALEAELESLEPLREHLSSVEIHVDIDDGTQIIKPVGIGGGIILEEDDGIRSLMLGFPETPPPIPLLKYMKAKLMLSNQVIATIPGDIFPIMKMYGPDEMGIVLSPLPDVCVEGLLENLTLIMTGLKFWRMTPIRLPLIYIVRQGWKERSCLFLSSSEL